MRGRATLTMGASSTTMSCAVAITVRASPSRRGAGAPDGVSTADWPTPGAVSAGPDIADTENPLYWIFRGIRQTVMPNEGLLRLIALALLGSGSIEHLAQQPQQAAPLLVVEGVAPGHPRGQLSHQLFLGGDAVVGEDQVLDPPVPLAGFAV